MGSMVGGGGGGGGGGGMLISIYLSIYLNKTHKKTAFYKLGFLKKSRKPPKLTIFGGFGQKWVILLVILDIFRNPTL